MHAGLENEEDLQLYGLKVFLFAMSPVMEERTVCLYRAVNAFTL
jgi:hypothetical protein